MSIIITARLSSLVMYTLSAPSLGKSAFLLLPCSLHYPVIASEVMNPLTLLSVPPHRLRLCRRQGTSASVVHASTASYSGSRDRRIEVSDRIKTLS
jgi:hypothetical protein